jgi:ABC-type sugar transport system substrate-binding protein
MRPSLHLAAALLALTFPITLPASTKQIQKLEKTLATSVTATTNPFFSALTPG